ncbi:hypothetical protein [Pyrobaculum ferrireducens]|uniref:hypothetical protein n=1 Tax=Pyrobaculum ferrireducens TaxID=1104324 RepID=UPI0011E4EC74|nr:hypothetical protein [Pyrobaculum ferrireducens]
MLALATIYLTDKPANIKLERYKLPVSPWVLPLAVFATAQTEVVVFGHTGLPSLVATGVALGAVLLLDDRVFKKVAITASIVGVLVAVMYSQYTPASVTTLGATLHKLLNLWKLEI